jgi:peptide/nickel transport system substrate-binding protein
VRCGRRWIPRLAPIAGLFLAAVLFACGTHASRDRPLRIAQDLDILSLDPLSLEFSTVSALSNVFEGLVGRDGEMRIQPALAVRWATEREGRTWLFHLRSGVRFHDGSALTAAVVKEAFDRVRLDSESPGKQLLDNVASVEATGDLVLRITTVEPDPLLLQRLVHLRVARGLTTREVVARHVGTGPYRLVSWEAPRRLVLEAFSEYWAGSPAVRHVELVDVAPGEPRLDAIARDEVDLAPLPHSVLDGSPPPSVTIVRGAGLRRMFLWVCGAERGPTSGPLGDARVRRAMALALDRRAIAKALTGDAEQGAVQLIPKGIFGSAANVAAESQDVAAARRLLVEAGVPQGFEAPLMILDRGIAERATARLVSEMLSKVGIRATLRAIPRDEVMAAFDGRARGLLVSYWTFDDGDAGSFLRDCIHSRAGRPGRGLFNPGVSDGALDRLIDDALTSISDVARSDRYKEIMERTAQTVPVVPLFDGVLTYGLAPGIHWKPRMDGFLLAADVTTAGPGL